MIDPFSEFSKGKVLCKYQLIVHVGNHKLRDKIFTVVLVGWIMGWLMLLRIWPESWIPIVIAFLPFLIGSWLFKMIFPYRVIGMVEFKDASLNIIQADGSHRSIDFYLLKRMRVGLSISKEFVAGLSSYSNQRAYRLQIKGKEELVDLHCLNALYLTKADEQQFMSPPPTLINTLGVVRDTYKLRFYDLKGNESTLI